MERKGETLGLSSLLKPYRNNVPATCNKKIRLLSINGEALRKLMRQNRKSGMDIMERVGGIYYSRLNNIRAIITNLRRKYSIIMSRIGEGLRNQEN